MTKATTEEPTTSDATPRAPASTLKPKWWQRPWVVPLAIVATIFLAFSLPNYVELDPSQSRVPPPEGLAWYYPTLVTHIGFATVAMLACITQVWPWFRQRFPAAHRRIGRVYVFGGVIPAGICGFAVALAAPFGPVASVSNVMLSLSWLFVTVTGFRRARNRKFGEHRRWMIRSFALTMSIVTNRIWGVVWAIVLAPQAETTFGGNEELMGQAIAGLTTWTGWVIPLLIVEWWLDRPRRRPKTRAA